MNAATLLFIMLAAISAGAVAYVFLFNRISAAENADRRLKIVQQAESERMAVKATRMKATEAAKRRKSVQDSLKEMDLKQKAKDKNLRKPPLTVQIRQAGMQVSIERFYVYSVVTGLVVTLIAVILGAPMLVLPGAMLAGTLGLPRWFVGFRRKRRVRKFLDEFPNALDVIVRAVKSGLPLNDGIRLIATEAQEPVRTEFRRIVDAQQMGLSIPDAALRMQETMPCQEAGFFGIVIQIQQQAGGNLSEALGNLSRVLRDRKKMKAKVQALSMEAKASAWIIGSLPVIVAVLVYFTSPGYITPLFVTSTGHIILGVSAFWMAIGVLVMRNMINFDL